MLELQVPPSLCSWERQPETASEPKLVAWQLLPQEWLVERLESQPDHKSHEFWRLIRKRGTRLKDHRQICIPVFPNRMGCLGVGNVTRERRHLWEEARFFFCVCFLGSPLGTLLSCFCCSSIFSRIKKKKAKAFLRVNFNCERSSRATLLSGVAMSCGAKNKKTQGETMRLGADKCRCAAFQPQKVQFFWKHVC